MIMCPRYIKAHTFFNAVSPMQIHGVHGPEMSWNILEFRQCPEMSWNVLDFLVFLEIVLNCPEI